jgi:hypothetical protein
MKIFSNIFNILLFNLLKKAKYNFLALVNNTVLAGMFNPIANVSVANNA